MKLFLVSAVLGIAVSFQKVFLLHVLFLFIGFILVNKNLREKSAFHFHRQPTSLHWFPLVMLIWYGVMTFWSQHFDHSVKYLFYVTNGLFIVLLMVYYTENVGYQRKVFKALGWTFVAEMIVALLEIYTPFHPLVSPLSPFLSFFGRDYSPDFDIKLLEHVPTAFHWNPNDLAIAMTLTFPFFLLAKKWAVKILGMTVVIIIVIADDSRACMLTLFLMIGLYILFYKRKILMFLIPALIALLIMSPLYYSHLRTTSIYDKIVTSFVSLDILISQNEVALDSIGLRQRLILDGVQAIKNHKGMGIGPGENMYLHKASIGKDYFALHNFWLELCVDAGVLFGLMFVAWHWYITFKVWKVSKSTKDPWLLYYSSATFLSMFGFFFSAISASSVIYFLPMWIMYGFAIATIHNGKRLKMEA